ncbi:hypothetical protein GCM10022600_02360 [Qipengyuania pelagi]|uniref:DUF2059 domain-containing protein n=1 Tax=Qipengyuania pelagi TaxID=994320 RepID=A0A844Y7K0_9SPHN|nr:DUF2059 domain-containing protein [Qipengyuania pelagi]MXO54620.1 DUF2059 domain-containing protein [Qipengyuania pelagi]
MKNIGVSLVLGVLSLALSAPAMAQDIVMGEIEGEVAIDDAEADGAMDEAAVLAMMSGLFQAEPLTAEQEARLPAATAIVATMMPEGFYGEIMRDMMEKTMRPMMAMFSEPDFLLASRLTLDEAALADLSDAEKQELLTMLDPAWDQRADTMVDALVSNMGGAFAAVEPPVRAGLAKAYAVRFDEAQLADISAFFATPTGGEFARQSMALFADPQVMGATMEAMPEMIGSFTEMETAMEAALESLPAERDYADLSMAQRARMADLLGVEPDALDDMVIPHGEGEEPEAE